MVGECKNCGVSFHYYPSNKSGNYCTRKCWDTSEENRLRMVKHNTGRKASPATKLKMSQTRKGKPRTPDQNRKITLAMTRTKRKQRDERIKQRKGYEFSGMPEIRRSPEYRLWRQRILDRDGDECVGCGAQTHLEVDHIVPFSWLFMEWQLDHAVDLFRTDNGRVLCHNCHKSTRYHATKVFQYPDRLLLRKMKKYWKAKINEGDFELWRKQQLEAWGDKLLAKLK